MCVIAKIFGIFFRHPRDVAKTPPCFLLLGPCVGICGVLGHHAPGGLGQLRPGTVWHLLHTGLVAGPGLHVRPELRHGHPFLLSHPPRRHHRLLLRHDHLQSEILSKGDLALWRPHQEQPQPRNQTHKGGLRGWGEGKAGTRESRQQTGVVEKIGWCVSCPRWRCWSAQASWLRGSLTQWCPWYRHSGSPTPCLLRLPSFPRCWPSPPPCTTPSSTRWWTWSCPAPVPPAAKPWRKACVLESRGKEVWNVSGNFPNLLL